MVLYSHRRLTRREALDDMSVEDTQPCRSDRTICKSSNLISRKGRKSLSLHRSSLHSKFLAIILISICSETAYLWTNVPNHTGALGEKMWASATELWAPNHLHSSACNFNYPNPVYSMSCNELSLMRTRAVRVSRRAEIISKSLIFQEAHKHFVEAKPKSEKKSYSHDLQLHIELICQYKLFISRRTSLPISWSGIPST
jgi:hypothetical protein